MLPDVSKHTVEMTWDQVEYIVCKELLSIRDGLVNDLEAVKNDTRGRVFDTDKKEDKKMIKKHIKAINLILAYHGVEA
jgi:hypothetical protein